MPIYVGKGIPPGARKCGFALSAAPGDALYKQSVEHAESVRQINNLKSASESIQVRAAYRSVRTISGIALPNC